MFTVICHDLLVRVLHTEKVMARRYCCHRMQLHQSYFSPASLLLPETEKLCNRVLMLPTGTAVGDTETSTVCDIISSAVPHGEELTRLLSGNIEDTR